MRAAVFIVVALSAACTNSTRANRQSPCPTSLTDSPLGAWQRVLAAMAAGDRVQLATLLVPDWRDNRTYWDTLADSPPDHLKELASSWQISKMIYCAIDKGGMTSGIASATDSELMTARFRRVDGHWLLSGYSRGE